MRLLMDNSDLKNDVDSAIKLLHNGKSNYWNYKKFHHYDSIYPYNNEAIVDYYDGFNYNGKVLSVASSGDHMLNAIVKGASDITLFDINKLTIYYCILKLVAASVLDRKEFFAFFGDSKCTAPRFYLKDIYYKIVAFLPQEILQFWNKMYENDISNPDRCKNLFNLISVPSDNAYYSDDGYNLLKDNVKKIDSIKFICSDIMELPEKLNDNDVYTTMFLSNICAYIPKEDFKKFCHIIFEDLYNKLIINGRMAYGSIRINYTDGYGVNRKIGNVYVYERK